MTWFPDLSTCDYFDRSGDTLSESDRLLAVGWLSGSHDYTRGTIDPAVRQALSRMLDCPWSPIHFLGSHLCELCVGAWGYAQRFLGSRNRQRHRLPLGHRNLFIPAGRVVYVAPELVVHYIEQHGYAPPEEFCNAVRACPPVWSDAYFAELRRSGSASFNLIVPPAVPPADYGPLPIMVVRLLKGMTLALEAIAGAARQSDYDRQLAWRLTRAIPTIVNAGIEIVSVSWLDERIAPGASHVELTVRGGDARRGAVEICEEKTSNVPARNGENAIGNFPILAFVPWRADPRRDIELKLAPAQIDYIGLDPVRGEAKAFLLDDRAPTDYLAQHPHLGLRSPSYGEWTVDIIPRRR
jgi:hypothetical protein